MCADATPVHNTANIARLLLNLAVHNHVRRNHRPELGVLLSNHRAVSKLSLCTRFTGQRVASDESRHPASLIICCILLFDALSIHWLSYPTKSAAASTTLCHRQEQLVVSALPADSGRSHRIGTSRSSCCSCRSARRRSASGGQAARRLRPVRRTPPMSISLDAVRRLADDRRRSGQNNGCAAADALGDIWRVAAER